MINQIKIEDCKVYYTNDALALEVGSVSDLMHELTLEQFKPSDAQRVGFRHSF